MSNTVAAGYGQARPRTRLKVLAGGRSSSECPKLSGPPCGEPTDIAEEKCAPAAISELYLRYGASVYSRCAYILKDKARAEDAMQDVFAKALESYAGFRAEASPLTWLMKIATHYCLNLIRSERALWRNRFRREEEDRLARGATGPESYETTEILRKLLGRFDPETQAVAIHYHVDGLSLEEVARLVGRSVPTVRKRLEDVTRAFRAEAF